MSKLGYVVAGIVVGLSETVGATTIGKLVYDKTNSTVGAITAGLGTAAAVELLSKQVIGAVAKKDLERDLKELHSNEEEAV